MHDQPPLWSFDRIAADDAARADALRAAPSSIELMMKVAGALRTAVSGGAFRIGWEESGSSSEHMRAVIQFHLGQQLFDWFFNAWTGYRAQFRHCWEEGLAYNNEIVKSLRYQIQTIKSTTVPARRLSTLFEDRGPTVASVDQILRSLDPELSKVWFCRKRMENDGVVSPLRVDLAGPRLVIDEYDSWAAPFAVESDAWLDLKGAFVCEAGLYQIKDPVQRAKDMQRLGSA